MSWAVQKLLGGNHPGSRSLCGIVVVAVLGVTAVVLTGSPASAFVPGTLGSLQRGADTNNAVVDVVFVRRGVAVRTRGAVVGPRGGVAYRSRTIVRGGAVVRPGVRPGVGWVRPANYRWRPGGAIAAGAAIGFVTAATAAAWAGAPSAAGYCWYYTDASRTNGFWDRCP
jgi:hypothetical protein